MARQPSLRSILWVDQIALMAVVLLLVSVLQGALAAAGLFAYAPAGYEEGALTEASSVSAQYVYSLSLAMFALGVAIMGWRVAKVRSAFALGSEVPGRITKIVPLRDRAFLTYTYEVRSKSVTSSHLAYLTKRTAIVEGGGVRVAVNPRSPKDGFVVELFG